jgi:hypothetical protein
MLNRETIAHSLRLLASAIKTMADDVDNNTMDTDEGVVKLNRLGEALRGDDWVPVISNKSIVAAVKLAAKASLEARSAPVPVPLPGWERYELVCHLVRLSKAQTYPSRLITVRNCVTKVTAWSVQAGEVVDAANRVVAAAGQTGWFGPVTVDYIPSTHPAYSVPWCRAVR